MKTFNYTAITLIALGLPLAGCTVSETDQLPDEIAPTFDDGQGQDPAPQAVDTHTYPGPYGLKVGSIIPNFALYGFPHYGGGDTHISAEVDLSHFYNPTGDETFAPGSIYGEGPKPHAVVLSMSAVWCPPCNAEANDSLPVEVPKYPDVKFVTTLLEGPTHEMATIQDVIQWAEKYQKAKSVFYPLVKDATSQVTSLYEPAFPGNMIIRTSDMKIMYRMAGINADFYVKLEQVLDGTFPEP